MSESDTNLYFPDVEKVENALISSLRLRVSEIHVGAKCTRQLPIVELIEKLRAFRMVESISLEDDYVSDKEKLHIEEAFRIAFPRSKFHWSHGLKLDEKHGR
jgi:hypothetical protein